MRLGSVIVAMFLLGAGLCWAEPAATQKERTYEIRVTRPWQVGDGWHMDLTMVRTSRVVAGDGAGPTMHGEITFLADVEVLVVDKKGMPTSVDMIVQQCRYRSGQEAAGKKVEWDEWSEPFTQGARVRGIMEKRKQTFTMDDKPLARPQEWVLGQIFPDPPAEEPPAREEIYGLGTPRKAGETWKLDPAKIVAVQKTYGLTLREKDVKATASLREVKVIDGVEMMDLEFIVEIANATSRSPAGEETELAVDTRKSREWVPADPSVRFPVKRVTEGRYEGIFTKGERTSEIAGTRNTRGEYTALKKKGATEGK